MMIRLGIIANFNSKIFRSNPIRIGKFEQIAGQDSIFRPTKNLKETFEAVKEFKEKNIGILGIVGGDGTLRLTLSKLIEAYGDTQLPQIAMLTGGTMNTTATSLGISGSPESLTLKLLNIARENANIKTEKRNILTINSDHGFIFGTGFYHDFIKIYYERAYPSIPKGLLLLSRTGLSALVNGSFAKRIFRERSARLTVNGKPLGEINYSAISCSTIQYIGYGLSPYKRALEKDNSYSLLIFPCAPRHIAMRIPLMYLGWKLSSNKITEDAVDDLVIESDTKIPYQLDGDLFEGSERLHIKTGPRLTFLSKSNFD